MPTPVNAYFAHSSHRTVLQVYLDRRGEERLGRFSLPSYLRQRFIHIHDISLDRVNRIMILTRLRTLLIDYLFQSCFD